MSTEHSCPICGDFAIPRTDGKHSCGNSAHEYCTWWTYQPKTARDRLFLVLAFGGSAALSIMALLAWNWLALVAMFALYALVLWGRLPTTHTLPTSASEENIAHARSRA
jgi:hypothetical protein